MHAGLPWHSCFPSSVMVRQSLLVTRNTLCWGGSGWHVGGQVHVLLEVMRPAGSSASPLPPPPPSCQRFTASRPVCALWTAALMVPANSGHRRTIPVVAMPLWVKPGYVWLQLAALTKS